MSIELSQTEDLGRQLGDAITETPEYEAFESAKRAVEDCPETQAKIDEFERVRQEFMMARQTGTATQDDLAHLQETQTELHSMSKMKTYLEAKATLSQRLDAINNVISQPLAVNFGEEAGGCCQE